MGPILVGLVELAQGLFAAIGIGGALLVAVALILVLFIARSRSLTLRQQADAWHAYYQQQGGRRGGASINVFWPFLLICAGVILFTMAHQPSPSTAVVPSDGVQGPPTITASFIEAVLAHAHSPAQGLGRDLYQLGQQYGIDPAYALAFFEHESSFGRAGVARVTLSLGNIECTPGYRCIDGYRAYSSWRAGAQDWYQLIKQEYLARGLTTLETILPVYAPASAGNNVHAYISSVQTSVARWRKGQV